MGTRKGYTRLVETERKCVIKHSDNGLQKMRFVAASGTSDQDSVDKARGKKILREKHLIDEANILSITFFAWTYQILKNGFYKTVSHMQSSLPPEEYTSLNISKEFRRRSEQVGRTALTATGLLKIIILINFKEMCTSLILCMIQEWLLKLGPVLMIGTLLRQLKSEHIDTKREIQLATAICIMFILKVFTGQHSLFLSRRSGIKARSALTSLIYEKAMRISHPGFQKTSPGQILNLITNDINDFDIKFPYLNYIIIVPVQTVIVSAIIWREFSPWSLFGLIIFLLIIIIQSSVGKLLMKLRHLRLKASDERIHLMTDILMNMKTVKMYGWEDSFSNVLSSYRKIECRNVRKTLLMKAITTGFMRVSVKLLMLLIFLIYFFQGSRNITSDKLFVLVTLCYSVRYSIPIFFPTAVAGASEMYSSLKRIQNFLSIEEHQHKKPVVETENPEISIVNASASWNIHNRILTDISFNVKGNKLITVVGPVGSGKTSFLMMVLKELELLEGIIDVKGSIAYVPQEAWLFSDTIRNNILFGRKFYSERFENIVDICGLRIDMESFPYGAESLVGERGIILSGGQRTRVSLARALYHDADIYLMDDPLSAVDSEVGKHIYNECILKYLKDKMRILVTHQVQYIQEGQQVILMDEGRAKDGSNLKELAEMVHKFKFDKQKTSCEPQKTIFQNSKCKTKDTNKESNKVGAIPLKIYSSYLRFGGNICAIVSVFVLNVTVALLFVGSDYCFKIWSEMEEHALGYSHQSGKRLNLSVSIGFSQNDTKTNLFPTITSVSVYNANNDYKILAIYSVLVIMTIVSSITSSISNYTICNRASVKLHEIIFNRMLHLPMHFFSNNPIGGVLNRFAKDIGTIDNQLPITLTNFTNVLIFTITTLIIVNVQSVWLIFFTVLVVLLFLPVTYLYMPTNQALKRLENSTKSPVYSHISMSMDGRTTIRAFRASKRLIRRFHDLQDKNIAMTFLHRGVESWFSFSGDLIGSFHISLSTIIPILLRSSYTSSTIGFIVCQVAQIAGSAQLMIRLYSQLQNEFTAVERVMEYGELQPEASKMSAVDKQPKKEWPNKGNIDFMDVSLRYSSHWLETLKSINFTIKDSEKIGVVGRTGAGKTSLVNALFRLNEFEGLIKIDGVNIKDIGLHDLRRSISVIPQEPILFTGTVRYNLDPFDNYEDNSIWRVLEEVNLKEVVDTFHDGLNTVVKEGDISFSFGQRQLICLARALLRNNRIIVLDEATSNVDLKTDEIVQRTIRSKFKGCTVITIAHRLNTVIDSDRILVIDSGTVAEFDEPDTLLKNKNSLFNKLVQESGVYFNKRHRED